MERELAAGAKKRISPKEASTYLPFEEFPSEIQLEIIRQLDPETHLRSTRVSKGFRVFTEEQKYEKKSLLFLQRGEDPVRIAIRKNNLDYFKYLLENRYHVYWGAILEMLYLDRNEFLKIYDFEIRNEWRIKTVLRIILETKNEEGYEIVKNRLKVGNDFHSDVYYLDNKINESLLRRMENDFSNFQFRSTNVSWEAEREHMRKSIRSKDPSLQFMLEISFNESIKDDDIDVLKILIEEKLINIREHQLISNLNVEILIEADILKYLLEKGVDFQEYFEQIAEIGNLYTAENLLMVKFKPSDATINHILQEFLEYSGALKYSFAEQVLDWMLSRHLIVRSQKDDILDIYPEPHE